MDNSVDEVDDFECQCEPQYNSACRDLPLYREDAGRQYCVLHFPDKAKQNDTKFQEAVDSKLGKEDYDFCGVYFPVNVNLSKRTFTKEVRFTGATFEQTADFYKTIFKEKADFSYATFKKQEARFAEAIFEKYVTFDNATFGQMANFYKATFNDKSEFSYAIFQKDASFPEAVFKKTSFSRATFEQRADFSACSFRGNADFFLTAFRAAARFQGEQTFSAQNIVDFRSTEIERPERFSFYGVILRPSWFLNADAVSKIDFTDIRWYRVPGRCLRTIEGEIEQIKQRGKDDPQSTDPYELLAKTCRELSANAEEDRDYLTANEFHYLSMEALREKRGKRFGLILNLYRWLSGYGERPLRAFGVLTGIWFVFAALYLVIPSSPFTLISLSDLAALHQRLTDQIASSSMLDFSPLPMLLHYDPRKIGQAAVYSLGALARLNPDPKPTPGLFQLLVIIEGLLGPLQIALLLLAVRRRVMR